MAKFVFDLVVYFFASIGFLGILAVVAFIIVANKASTEDD
jgi:hypothetical protein